MENISSKRQSVSLGGAEGPPKAREKGATPAVLVQAVERYLKIPSEPSGGGGGGKIGGERDDERGENANRAIAAEARTGLKLFKPDTALCSNQHTDVACGAIFFRFQNSVLKPETTTK